MKKPIKYIVLFIITGILVAFLPSYADEELIGIIPGEYRELFDLSEDNGLSKKDGRFFFSLILGLLGKAIEDSMPFFAVIFSLLLLTAISGLFSGSMSPGLCDAISYASALVMCITVMTEMTGLYGIISSGIEKSGAFASGLSPILSAAYLSAGMVTSAGVSGIHFSLIVSLLQNVVKYLLLPLMTVCRTVTVWSVLSDKPELSRLSGFLGKTFIRLLSLLMLVLTTVFGYQTVISASTDSLSLKAAKLIGGSIPLVGSAITSASGTIAGSFRLIRNLCGGVGIAVLLLILLPPLITLSVNKAVLSLCSDIASSFNDKKMNALLSSGADILSYGISLLVISDITLILSIGIFSVFSGI